MTIAQLKAKIIEWVKTGEPKNIKSYNMRSLLQDISKKLPDVENFALNKIYAIGKDGDELKSVEINPVEYTFQSLTQNQQIQALENMGLKTILIEGNRFFWYKKPGNTGSVPQADDIAVLGWQNSFVFRLMLKYVEGDPSLFSSWVNMDVYEYLNIPYYIDCLPSQFVDFPAMQRGGTFAIHITNNKGIEQPNAKVWLGGTSGISVGHKSIVICMVDSTGGAYSSEGYKFIIINQKKQTIISRLDHYDDLQYPGIDDYIYLIEDTGNTYVWSIDLNDYVQIGATVEGELIDDVTFHDIDDNPVTPSGGNIYIDITQTPNVAYRWNGTYYSPINSTSTGGSGTPNFAYLNDQQYVKYSEATGRLESGKISETSAGIDVNGNIKTQAVELENETGTPLPNQITRNGKKAQYTNDVGVTENIQVGSNVFVYTPTSNFTISAIKAGMETAGKNFNDCHIIIALGSNNYTCSIDLNAPNYIFTLERRGSGSISFSSTRTLNSGVDGITIMNGNESSMALITCGTSVDYLKVRNF